MKALFSLLAILFAVNLSYAQNTVWPSPTSTSSVGIGTINPVEKLHVQGTAIGTIKILVENTSVSNTGSASFDALNDNGKRLNLGVSSSIYNSAPLIGPNSGFLYGDAPGGLGFALTATGSTFRVSTNGWNERFRIDALGNVGIGTTTPHQRLDLNGGSLALGDINASGGITFRNDIPLGTAGSLGISAIDAAGNGNNDGLGLHISDGLKILSGSTTYFTLLSSSGNVGIGTTNPDQKLTVNGTIHSKEVKVDTNIPVPDYVFDADYKLATLTEVKDYIAKNHHLPEMPSAAQIEKDGLKLGEMNMLLLKKVEELTLHLIEQNKLLQENKKENEALRQDLETFKKETRKK